MRPIIALVIAAAIILGVQGYISATAHTGGTATKVTFVEAEGKFVVELLLTFDAGPDEFALEADNAPSVVLSLAGKELLRRSEVVKAGETIVLDAPGVVEGTNEFLLVSSPVEDDPDAVRAARIRVLKNDDLVVEEWIASEPGLAAEGTVTLEIPASSDPDVENED